MKVTGSCYCGSIAYEADVDSQKVGLCHCTDCQKLSASAFRWVAIAEPNSFRITKGTPSTFVKTAASGNAREQGFCGTCGSAIYSVSPNDRSVHVLRAGTIDQREHLKPQFEIWRSSAPDWVPTMQNTIVHEFDPD
jgi:hypothetical protein